MQRKERGNLLPNDGIANADRVRLVANATSRVSVRNSERRQGTLCRGGDKARERHYFGQSGHSTGEEASQKSEKNMRQRSGLIFFRQKGETSVSGACDRTRTGTGPPRGILSPLRLPFRHTSARHIVLLFYHSARTFAIAERGFLARKRISKKFFKKIAHTS